MGKVYAAQFEVQHYQVDRYGNLMPSMLVRLLIEATIKQTASLLSEISNEALNLDGTWFVVQTDVTFQAIPRAGEIIRVETEAIAYQKFFTQRRFTVYCEQKVIATALMKYVYVSRSDRKLLKIKPENISLYGVGEQKLLPMYKMKTNASDVQTKITFTVNHTEIDENQHVNNAVYIDWAIDGLDDMWLANYYPQHMSIQYSKETTSHTKMTQSVIKNENITFHLIEGNDELHCKVEITWQKNNESY